MPLINMIKVTNTGLTFPFAFCFVGAAQEAQLDSLSDGKHNSAVAF